MSPINEISSKIRCAFHLVCLRLHVQTFRLFLGLIVGKAVKSPNESYTASHAAVERHSIRLINEQLAVLVIDIPLKLDDVKSIVQFDIDDPDASET